MTKDPYSPPSNEEEFKQYKKRSSGAVVREIIKYAGSYLIGIIAAISLTPVDVNMGSRYQLWFLYPILAPICYFLFYLYLEGAYLPFGGKGLTYWLYFAVGMVPIALEVLAYLLASRSFRALRPLWIGFPVGFVGTLGVYYSATASI